MIEYRYDTQLLIDGEDLDEDAINDYFVSLGEIYDIVVEDMDRQARNLHG